MDTNSLFPAWFNLLFSCGAKNKTAEMAGVDTYYA